MPPSPKSQLAQWKFTSHTHAVPSVVGRPGQYRKGRPGYSLLSVFNRRLLPQLWAWTFRLNGGSEKTDRSRGFYRTGCSYFPLSLVTAIPTYKRLENITLLFIRKKGKECTLHWVLSPTFKKHSFSPQVTQSRDLFNHWIRPVSRIFRS